jgi:hypothetical protein
VVSKGWPFVLVGLLLVFATLVFFSQRELGQRSVSDQSASQERGGREPCNVAEHHLFPERCTPSAADFNWNIERVDQMQRDLDALRREVDLLRTKQNN